MLFDLTVRLSLNGCKTIRAAALCCHSISGAANNVLHVLQPSVDVCNMLTLNFVQNQHDPAEACRLRKSMSL